MKIQIFHQNQPLTTVDWPVVPGVTDQYLAADGQRYVVVSRCFSGSVSKPEIRLDVIPISAMENRVAVDSDDIPGGNGKVPTRTTPTTTTPTTANEDDGKEQDRRKEGPSKRAA